MGRHHRMRRFLRGHPWIPRSLAASIGLRKRESGSYSTSSAAVIVWSSSTSYGLASWRVGSVYPSRGRDFPLSHACYLSLLTGMSANLEDRDEVCQLGEDGRPSQL